MNKLLFLKDLIYGYYSSILLELAIHGLICNLLLKDYKNTIFDEKIFFELTE